MPDSFEAYDFNQPKKKSWFSPETFTSDPYEQSILQKIADASSGIPEAFSTGANWLNENVVQPQIRGGKTVADYFFRKPLDQGISAAGGEALGKMMGYRPETRHFRERLAGFAGKTVGAPFGAPGEVMAKQLIAPELAGEESSQAIVPANLAGAAVPFLRGNMSKAVDLGVSGGQGLYGAYDYYNAKTQAEKNAALMQMGLALPGIIAPGTGEHPTSVGKKAAGHEMPTSSILDEVQVNNALNDAKASVPDRFRQSRALGVQNISAPSDAEINAFLANRPGEIPRSTPEGPAVPSTSSFGDSPTARMLEREQATRNRMRQPPPDTRGAMSLFPTSMSPEMKAGMAERNAAMNPEMWNYMYAKQFADENPAFPSDRWNAGLDEHVSTPDEGLTNDIMSEVRDRAAQGLSDDALAAHAGRVKDFQQNSLTNDIWRLLEERTRQQPSNAVDINDILNNPRNAGAPMAPELPPEPGVPPMGQSWVDRLGPYTGPRTDADAFVSPGPPVSAGGGGGPIMGGPGRGGMFDQPEQGGMFGIGEPLEPTPVGMDVNDPRATGGNQGAPPPKNVTPLTPEQQWQQDYVRRESGNQNWDARPQDVPPNPEQAHVERMQRDIQHIESVRDAGTAERYAQLADQKLMEAIYNNDEVAEAYYRNLSDAANRHLENIQTGKVHGGMPDIELVDEASIQNNASGESGASVEAMNRLKQMRQRGESFVVYDRAGRPRPILNADAVDYVPRPGETFGIQGPNGFRVLTDNGGRPPRTAGLPNRMGIPDDRMSGDSFGDPNQRNFDFGENISNDPRDNQPPPNWMPDEPTNEVQFEPEPQHAEYLMDDAEPLPSSAHGTEFTSEEPNVIARPSDTVTVDEMMALKARGYRPAGRNAKGDLLFQKVTPGQPTPESMAGTTVGGPKRTPKLLQPGETKIYPAAEVSPQRLGQWRRRGYIVEPQSDGSFKVTGGSGTPQDVPVLETEVGNIRPTAGRGQRQAAGQVSPPQSPLGALGGPPAIPGASGGPPPLPPRGPSSGAPGAAGGPSGGGQPPPLPPAPGSAIPPNLPTVHPTTGQPLLKPPTKLDYATDLFNLSRTTLSAGDMSGAFRQGIGLVTKPAFWKHLATTYPQSIFSEAKAQTYDNALRQRALFRKRTLPNGNTGPSFAEEAGLFIADLNHQVGKFTGREETMISKMAEQIPGVRASNRGYTNFLNHVRADVFESLIKDSNKFGVNALHNIDYARDLADFVNTASGRGSLNTPLGNLEPAAKALNTMWFSPRLIASRLRMLNMLNPVSYAFRPPQLRREALKSLFGIAAFGATMTTLGKMAGGEVGTDPESSDFGKIKIGNTRFDPYGGLQQWAVFSNRMMSGRYKSSNPDIEAVDLDNPTGPYDPNRMDIALRFARGKVHPMLGLAWSIMNAQKEMSGKKMKFDTSGEEGMDMLMENALMQRFIPLLAQDVYEVYKSEPDIVPAGIAAVFGGLGGGVQSYGGREEFKEENNPDFGGESSFEEDDFQ